MTKAFQQNISEVRQAPPTPKDDISLFTEHIAMQLRAVKDPQQVAIMQNSIENALFQCRMKFWGNPTGMSRNQLDPHVSDGPTIGHGKNPIARPASVPRSQPSHTFVPSRKTQSSPTDFIATLPCTQGEPKESRADTNLADDETVQQDTILDGISVVPTTSNIKKGASSVGRKRKTVGMGNRTTRMTLRQKPPIECDDADKSDDEHLPDI
jgi:hypothetical protein